MEITYKNNEFRIKGKTGVLYSKPNGLPAQAGVLVTSPDGNTSKELFGAGEYEVSGISVIGLQTEEANVFVYEVDGFRICNLNGIFKKLTDSKLSILGDIDILLLPVNDKSIELMQQIESYFVIPYKQNLAKEELDKFLKESGLVVEKMAKFNLKKEEIIEESPTQIIVLST